MDQSLGGMPGATIKRECKIFCLAFCLGDTLIKSFGQWVWLLFKNSLTQAQTPLRTGSNLPPQPVQFQRRRPYETGSAREAMMSRKRFSARSRSSGCFGLREADVRLSQGRNVGRVCRETGITEQTFYGWRKEYGGMKTSQIKRLKDLEGRTPVSSVRQPI